VTVHALNPTSEITVHPQPELGGTFRLPVEVVVATTESVVAAADGGSDSFEVTTYDNPVPRFTVYGESPSTRNIGDDLTVRDGTGRAQLQDTGSQTKGDGTVTATYTKGSGTVVRIDYHEIEKVTLIRDSKLG
jgi:hypothetical protein